MAELIQYANGIPGIRFCLDKSVIRIGRNEEDNDICVADSYVSKAHALIEMKRSASDPNRCEFVLRDLGSTNRTYVNKKQISQITLKDNDIVYLGQNMFRFHCSGNEVMAESALELVTVSSDTLEFDSESIQLTNGFSRRLRVLGYND